MSVGSGIVHGQFAQAELLDYVLLAVFVFYESCFCCFQLYELFQLLARLFFYSQLKSSFTVCALRTRARTTTQLNTTSQQHIPQYSNVRSCWPLGRARQEGILWESRTAYEMRGTTCAPRRLAAALWARSDGTLFQSGSQQIKLHPGYRLPHLGVALYGVLWRI